MNDEELDFFGLVLSLNTIKEDALLEKHNPLEQEQNKKLVKKTVVDALEIVNKSNLESDNDDILAEFELSEIRIGNMLGSGGFARCYEVESFSLSSDKQYLPEIQAARERMCQNTTNESSGQYAIKHLRRSLTENPEKFASAVVDLAVEAHFLSCLHHSNICKIRGVSRDGPCCLIGGRYNDFFLVVEKLPESLDERIYAWNKQLKRLKRFPYSLKRNKRHSQRLLLKRQQYQAALDIASAVEYIHSKGIIHRDVKVSNCGFDESGKICKLFDFGLAAETRIAGFNVLLNEKVGSSRYCAPEVALGEFYGISADVYSFAMTLYECVCPWERVKRHKHNNNGDSYKPPSISSEWSPAIQKMMRKSLSPKSSERPTMSEICTILRREIQALDEESQIICSCKKKSQQRRLSHGKIDKRAKQCFTAEEEASEVKSVPTLVTQDITTACSTVDR